MRARGLGAMWLVSLACGVASAQEGPVGAEFLERFEASPRWQTINDGVMGGRSRGGFTITDGVLRFEGSINTNGGGFSSIRSEPRRSWGLDGSDGIVVRVRGDGRTYQWTLRTGERVRGIEVSYRAPFTVPDDGGWHEVTIPFEQFQPYIYGRRLRGLELDPGAVRQVGVILADEQDGPFWLELDWIGVPQRFY